MRVITPKHLHKPFRILWFESDELFFMFAGLILGIYVHVSFFPILFALAFIIRKMKVRFNRGFVRQLPYFLGLMRFRYYPSFFESHFSE